MASSYRSGHHRPLVCSIVAIALGICIDGIRARVAKHWCQAQISCPEGSLTAGPRATSPQDPVTQRPALPQAGAAPGHGHEPR